MTATIIVGSDGSGPSRSALRWAVQRAATLEMRVILCHVLDVGWAGPDHGSENTEAAALRRLGSEASLARSISPQVDVSCSVRVGPPVAVLADLARDADLLVVGTHKTGFIQGRAFESKFTGLVSSIETPVAFIPDLKGSYRRGVVAGIDRSPVSGTVALFAAAEAERCGDRLTLIGAWDTVDSESPQVEPSQGRVIAAQVEDSLQLAAQLAARHSPHLVIRTRNLHRRVADAFVDAASDARLLVIGHSTDTARASTVHDVLLNLSSPTVVVHRSPDPVTVPATVSNEHQNSDTRVPHPL